MCNEVHYSCLILEVSTIERLFYLLNSMSIDTSTYILMVYPYPQNVWCKGFHNLGVLKRSSAALQLQTSNLDANAPLF